MTKTRIYTQSQILGEPTPRDKTLLKIRSDKDSYRLFSGLKPKQQENILAFLTGERGLEVLLDSFFKKLFDPFENKARICSLLSALLEREVADFTVLTREGEQMYEKGSLVIMDILVRLTDGSLVDVEMQKIGYRFPSQRSTCYASDLVMRQYNALRAEHGDRFNYRMIRPVNIFVIIESPDNEFKISPEYLHKRQVSYSSGIELPETVNITYLTLDRFRKSIDNVSEPLDKWLAFFTYKEPADIISLVNRFPEFLPLYHDIAEFRKDPKEAISMYSEALAVLDHNTELYMIEEKQQEIDALRKEKDSLRQELHASDRKNQSLQEENCNLQQELAQYKAKFGKL